MNDYRDKKKKNKKIKYTAKRKDFPTKIKMKDRMEVRKEGRTETICTLHLHVDPTNKISNISKVEFKFRLYSVILF